MNTLLMILAFGLFSNTQHQKPFEIYKIQFDGIDRNVISMADYQNKHLLIIEFDAAYPDRDQLMKLDSLYKSDTAQIAIIAIPALDFHNSVNATILKSLLRDTLGLSFPISEVSYAKTEADTNQHVLMQWITKKVRTGMSTMKLQRMANFFL